MTHAPSLDHLPFADVRGVSVRFGARLALADASFTLPAESVTAVVGANGAGKTTLLRLLSGTLAPTAGRIAWPASGTAPRVALVGQTVALYPFLTVRENCMAAGRMVGLRGAALGIRAAAVMEQTLCREVEHGLAARLSGGFARRAAVAAALMGDAALVILDEPTTGLDATGVEALIATVRTLRGAGKTIVAATHDFAFADAVADHALFLRDGRLEAADAPQPLCRRLFPAAVHVEVTPAAALAPDHVRLLAQLGARQRSTSLYSLLSATDTNGFPFVLARLQDAGLRLRETRIGAPGMALLFERFCEDAS